MIVTFWTLLVLLLLCFAASICALFCLYKGHVKRKVRKIALHSARQRRELSGIAVEVHHLRSQAAKRTA